MTRDEATAKLREASSLIEEVRKAYTDEGPLDQEDTNNGNIVFWLTGTVINTLHVLINRRSK